MPANSADKYNQQIKQILSRDQTDGHDQFP